MADAITAAGLPGNFFAWLSDSTGDSPSANFTQSAVPYVRVDEVMVASSWADLTDTTILAPIEVNELGGRPRVDPSLIGGETDPGIWTGTFADGMPGGGDFCFDWTVAAGGTESGQLTIWAFPERWTQAGAGACDGPLKHLYCFEQ